MQLIEIRDFFLRAFCLLFSNTFHQINIEFLRFGVHTQYCSQRLSWDMFEEFYPA